ncbi:MAG: DUF3179 domain-containing protein [Planctomycetaceae bacterium]|jgi:hypothetical protein|nr:DUF3179 domain-containing protein [Planctomycetaceae bacterium]MBT6153303.1 DUF3179 domain-containing protein [Planctomycetaceae bacterium]MBT6483222.1 DUF3179 domain-containing protein [Planctomycetaceae bacterium]MBT6496341.1 DUF3179 domain-containing protein [Planctomycetaceae bacterium]
MCHNGIVYARTLEGRTLTFAVSGMLWEMSLVMIDQETRSLWSHLLGESMRGPLQGQSLEMIPSVITDWKTWKEHHPQTTCLVLSRTTYDYTSKTAHDIERLLIGVAEKRKARAWKFSNLIDHPVVNDTFSGRPVVVVYDEMSGTAVLHGRRVNGRVLTFQWDDGKLIDLETASEWDLLTGLARSGPMQGRKLSQHDSYISYHHAWLAFHYESSYWSPELD